MRKDNREVKKCVVCGKHFISTNSKVVCCSQECQKKRNKQLQNEARRKYVSQKEPKKKTKTLAELSVEARAAGMTYGQYVAKMGL